MDTPAASILPATSAALRPDRTQPDLSLARSREEAKRLAKDFEAMFVAEMLAPVFDSIKTDGPFGGGSGEAAFRPFLLDSYAKSITQNGGVGIADAVLGEILRMQGISETEPTPP